MTIDFESQQLEGLLQYLATRPWGEVNQHLQPLLSQLEAQRKAEQEALQQRPQLHAVDPAAAA